MLILTGWLQIQLVILLVIVAIMFLNAHPDWQEAVKSMNKFFQDVRKNLIL